MRVAILQHPKERLSKCSLTPLRLRDNLIFHTLSARQHYLANGHSLLGLEGPLLGPQDRERPLLLLDSTWRYLPQLQKRLLGQPLPRSLPSGLQTACPRHSKIFQDPPEGLASVEALYIACHLLGHADGTLLDGYAWKDAFLKKLAGTHPHLLPQSWKIHHGNLNRVPK